LNTLKKVTHIFCQNQESKELLLNSGVAKVSVAGDTRFDRVVNQAKDFVPIEKIETWIGDRRAIVAGSTWPVDDKLIANFLSNAESDVAFIIAPHEIKDSQIKGLSESTGEVDRFSQWNAENSAQRILVVDQIGLLSRIYRYGVAAYIGGGFGAGIHNTLEAAVYGIPVVFGPKFEKFREAVDLKSVGAAFAVTNQSEFDQVMTQLLEGDTSRREAGQKAKNYVKTQAGATQEVLKSILR